MERLDKIIADREKTVSRRDARALVKAGHVTVNGERAMAHDMKIAPEDSVCLHGRALGGAHVYIMLNKPLGVLSTTRDKKVQTVLDLVPDTLYRSGLFPAGRLDKYSTGLVIITNDGDFSHRILVPKNRIPKTYLVEIDKALDTATLVEQFAMGVDIGGGEITSPSELESLAGAQSDRFRVTIYEGKYHQVRRMFERFGADVTALHREQIGTLILDKNLQPGECMEIMHKEILDI